MTDANYNALIFTCVFLIGLFPFIKDPWKREPAVNGIPVWYRRPNWSFYPMLVFFVIGIWMGWQKDRKDEEDKISEREANDQHRKVDSTLAANRHAQDSTALWKLVNAVRLNGFDVDTVNWTLTKTKVENSFNNSSNNKNSNNVNSNNNNKNSNNSNSNNRTNNTDNSSKVAGIIIEGAVGVHISGANISNIGSAPPDVGPLPVGDIGAQELQNVTMEILESDLPVFTDITRRKFMSYVDSLTAAKGLRKEIVLAIDKKSNGILAFTQLREMLTTSGYKIIQIGIVNNDLNNKLPVQMWPQGDHLVMVFGTLQKRIKRPDLHAFPAH